MKLNKDQVQANWTRRLIRLTGLVIIAVFLATSSQIEQVFGQSVFFTEVDSQPDKLLSDSIREQTQLDDCPSANPIVKENCEPGTLDWLVTNYNTSIEGFASATSVNKGERLSFFINTNAANFDMEIYRSGYYGGLGGRLMEEVRALPGQSQPDCQKQAELGLASCSNWDVSYELTVPKTWVSGVYLAKLIRPDTGGENMIYFVVRDDDRDSDILWQQSVTTYQAYNWAGDKSLYSSVKTDSCLTVAEAPRAVKVSLDRPLIREIYGRNNYILTDFPMVFWLEGQGYDVTYNTNIDTHRSGMPNSPNELLDHRIFLSVGHDEYWTQEMRDAITEARDNGVHLGFFSSNVSYWKIRLEPDPWSGISDRVIVGYKTAEGGVPDPSGMPTSTWRDQNSVNDPENELIGIQYIGDNDLNAFPLRVYAHQSQHPLYRHTDIPDMPPDTYLDIGHHLIGWEWDAVTENGRTPENLEILAESPTYGAVLADEGHGYTLDLGAAHVTRYVASSGAQVFAAGTNQWAWGLAVFEPEPRIQQITYNVFADMGVQPATPDDTLTLDEGITTVSWPRVFNEEAPVTRSPVFDKVIEAVNRGVTGGESSPRPVSNEPAPVISDVQIQPAEDSALVLWKTDKPASGQIWAKISSGTIDFTLSSDNGWRLPIAASALERSFLTEQKLMFRNLDPNTTYYLQIAATDSNGNTTISDEVAFQTSRGSISGLLAAFKDRVGRSIPCQVEENLLPMGFLAAFLFLAVVGALAWFFWPRSQDPLETKDTMPQAIVDGQIEKTYFNWLDYIKAFALLWIFLNHIAERLFGFPYIANPGTNWPSLTERISQLLPLTGFGLWTIPFNITRYAGWFGDQGVQLFLIVSGFGLTWGLLARHQGQKLPLWPFYKRRASRIFPLWWGAHLFFVVTWLFLGWGLDITDQSFYLSLIGFRFVPGLLYYFSPAWWYIALLLQLYLIFPLLWYFLHRLGPKWLLIAGCLVAFASRVIGGMLFEGYLDPWMRGAIFITRLPEFIFGMSLAAWMFASPAKTHQQLVKSRNLFLMLLLYGAGLLMSLTLLGMAAAPFILGASAFVLLYAFFSWRSRMSMGLSGRVGSWLGRHTYSLYLMHHSFILLMVPFGLFALSRTRTAVGILAAVVLTVGSALLLEWFVGRVMAYLLKVSSEKGLAQAVLRLGLALVVFYGILLLAELGVRQFAPQEAQGWGERPSLQPHPEFGWSLIPSQTTRLRWESYDYTVTANELGFPGPAFPVEKAPNTLRIMTIGDAFTSAEGVDTEQSWPRMLEKYLAEQLPEQNVEVLNFGITGYGPNQYAAVVDKYVPIYEPDVIIIGLFVNDYWDVLRSQEDFQTSIGFDRQPPDSLYSIAQLDHLKRLVQLNIYEPMFEFLNGRPRRHGYFLGHFNALERDQPVITGEGYDQVLEKLSQIQDTAVAHNARVLIAGIPAPVQACGPDQLTYFPKNVDLTNESRYDLDQPQRVTKGLAEELSVDYINLLPLLAEGPDCLYQPGNLHWTVTGHEKVAQYLTEVLKHEGE